MNLFYKRIIKAAHILQVFFLLLSPSILTAEPLLKIVDMAWTSGFTADADLEKNRNPAGRYKDKAPFGQPLYLWIKLQGNAKALEKLKDNKELIVFHKWTYNYYGWETERLNIAIGRDDNLDDKVLSKLELEVLNRGYFDWRTCSKKDNLINNTKYTVTTVDQYDDLVECNVKQSCEMTIHVQ